MFSFIFEFIWFPPLIIQASVAVGRLALTLPIGRVISFAGGSMHSKHALYSTLFALLLFSSSARSEAGQSANRYTLQIAAFPESEFSQKFIDELKRAGENPAWGTVELPGRGKWVRIYVGTFKTPAEARRYGEKLVAQKIIKEFLVRPLSQIKTLSRPRSVADNDILLNYDIRPTIAAKKTVSSKPTARPMYKSLWMTSPTKARAGRTYLAANREANQPTKLSRPGSNAQESNLQAYDLEALPGLDRGIASYPASIATIETDTLIITPSLPSGASLDITLVPPIDTSLIPRPDPVLKALEIVSGEKRQADGLLKRGGLWLTGDREEGLARLRWIVGADLAELIGIDEEGKVRLDDSLLARMSGVEGKNESAASLKVADYITSNEGLLLLVQLVQGAHKYCLHIGRQAPTAGAEVVVSGSINLDNNFDSRINPYRRLNKKLDQERPPEGFDCLIGINPAAQWYNLRAGRLVPGGHITFHELTEAHAKVALGLDYLGQGPRPGAHNIALERENRLKAQRPFGDVVITVGSNRVLRNEKEFRQFYVEAVNKERDQR